MNLKSYIRNVPDFPKEGIMFKDITPLLKDKNAFMKAIDLIKENYEDVEIDYIVGIESRGFIVGTPLSYAMEKGFIPIRKPGKLPAEKIKTSYDLEYGSNELELHRDAIDKGDKVLIIDDLLATGGTVQASCELVEELGGDIVGIGFLLELEDLNGREKLKGYDVFSLLKD
ncbi:MAG: adenine phosphoribosyltransferase [Bacillota bacterium]